MFTNRRLSSKKCMDIR